MMVAEAGERLSDANGPTVTANDAVAVAELSVPVTVCGPATVAVQLAALHDPSGLMLKVVAAVTLPRSFPYWSNASTAYVMLLPAWMVVVRGLRVMRSTGPPVTVSGEAPAIVFHSPTTWCGPAFVVEHVLPAHGGFTVLST